MYDANTWTSEEGKKVLDTVGTLVSKYTHKDTVSNATSGNFKVKSAERNRRQSIIYAKR